MGLYPADEELAYQAFFGRYGTGKTVDLIVYDVAQTTPTTIFSGSSGIEELPTPRNAGKFQKKLTLPDGSYHFSWRLELSANNYKYAHEDVVVTALGAEGAIETQEI